MKRSQNKGSDCDAGQQSREDRNHSFPYSPDAAQIDEQHVNVDEDFNHDDGGVQDTICIKHECNWHGERRKPVAEGAIHKGRKQSDPGKHDHGGVKRRHLQLLQLPRPAKWRGIIAQERADGNAGRIERNAEGHARSDAAQ